MRTSRFAYVLMFALLLASNWVISIWLQSGVSTAWAKFLASPSAVATIPQTFSYQGVLRDASGNLVTGSVTVTLTLYDSLVAGNNLYIEAFPNTNVRDGAFNLVVGSTATLTPTIFTNGTVYLGLKINSDPELMPRQKLHAVPWSIFASEAGNAATANNLVNGGGVPNQLTFSSNGGTIIDSSTGMTLTGGGNGKVIIGDDLVVNGDWRVKAIRDVGNSESYSATHISDPFALSRSEYEVSLKRYVVEAADNGTSPDSVAVDDAILTELCQDLDGCELTLAMRTFGAGQDILAPQVRRFIIGATAPDGNSRPWQSRDYAGGWVAGVDGTQPSNVVVQAWSCFLEDVSYHNGQKVTTDKLGFHLLNWYGSYDNVDMVCVLVVED